MKTFTIADIRSWGPCYDPARHLPEDWSGTAIDILRMESIPPKDRLWVVLREGVLDLRTLRLFAIACARRVQHLMADPRSITAIDVAERHVNGLATDEELEAAARAAEWAAAAAARAARAAAWAAWAETRAARAARAAAWAARAAADAEAEAAAWAAWAAADAEAEAAARVTRDDERNQQVCILVEMLGEMACAS